MIISTRRFEAHGQTQFANLTGDYNPMHIDPVRARREMLGDVVVHGMHAVMQAIEDFVQHEGWDEPRSIAKLKVSFANAIYLDKECTLTLVESSSQNAKFKLTGEYGSKLMTLQLQWQEGAAAHESCVIERPASSSLPNDLTLQDTDARQGTLSREIQCDLLEEMFPRFQKTIGSLLATELAALTRLVGMECPGLQSIFSGFELTLREQQATDQSNVEYVVTKADARISRIAMETESSHYMGTIECFYRPRPEKQLSYSAAKLLVEPGECDTQVAWIIGGTRGIGEVTAKAICAAGGRCIVTYYKGRDDAERLVAEMTAEGGDAVAMPFDHASPAAGVKALEEAGVTPNAIYYFASPKIFVQKGVQYEHALFEQFSHAYLQGIAGIHQACRDSFGPQPLVIFHPSSSAIDQPVKGLAEYSAAKAAAEIMLEHMQKFDKALTVVESRLPRIATDQTMTLTPFPAEKAETVMLPLIRQVSAAIAEFAG